MIYVINNNDDPYFNHAAEEYLLNNFHEEVFMLWINKPSILIGRNQNTISEINTEYVESNGIEVVRRLSGGGAVFNDFGNINFTFITYRDGNGNSFKRFATPLIETLDSLNIKAEFTGRNDITIGDKKISGNAQYYHKDKLLHHGTILYNCELNNLSKALKSRTLKFKTRKIKSVASRVTNIASHLEEEMDLLDFKDYFMDFVVKRNNIKDFYEFTEEDLREIKAIRYSRFKSWDWTWANSSDFSYENAVKYPSGSIEYRLNISNGKIDDISLFGDFFGEKDIAELESRLKGARYKFSDLEKALSQVDIGEYIQGVSNSQFLDGIIGLNI